MVVFVCCSGFVGWNQNKTAIIRFFFLLHIVCKNQKLYFSESFRSVESFDPSCFFLASFFLDRTAAVTTTTTTTKTMTQNNGFSNTAFDELPVFSSLIFAGLVVILILLYFRTEFVFIVADRREVLCLVHRIEPKRQGFTLPLGRISLSFFSRMSTSPRCFWIWTGFPLLMSPVYYEFFPFVWLWVSFVLVRLCFGWQVNKKPRSAVLACPGFECVRRTRALVLLSRGRTKRYARYTSELPWSSSSACGAWRCSFS